MGFLIYSFHNLLFNYYIGFFILKFHEEKCRKYLCEFVNQIIYLNYISTKIIVKKTTISFITNKLLTITCLFLLEKAIKKSFINDFLLVLIC